MEAPPIVLEGRRASRFLLLLHEIDAELKRDGLGYLFADEPTVRPARAGRQPADRRKEG